MPGASRLNIKILLYGFFVFLGSSPCVEIVELYDYCSGVGSGLQGVQVQPQKF